MMMQIKSRWDKVSDLHTGHVLCVFIHGRTQSGWNRWLHGLPSHHKIKHKGCEWWHHQVKQVRVSITLTLGRRVSIRNGLHGEYVHPMLCTRHGLMQTVWRYIQLVHCILFCKCLGMLIYIYIYIYNDICLWDHTSTAYRAQSTSVSLITVYKFRKERKRKRKEKKRKRKGKKY